MILDKTSRNFLDLLTSEPPNMPDNLFTTDYLSVKLGLSDRQVLACMRFLEERKLVHVVRVTTPGIGNKMIWGIEATHQAFHRKEFEILHFVETLFTSVLLPVVVAGITAFLIA